MANTIVLKRSFTAASQPAVNDLAQGEVAWNVADGMLYGRQTVGMNDYICEVGAKPTQTASTSASDHFLLFSDSSTTGAGYFYKAAGIKVQPSPNSLICTGNVTAYSDIRLKKDIRPISDPIKKVQQIRGCTFEWLHGAASAAGRSVGVIAQEVEAVLPEAVHTGDDGYKSLAYGNMIGLLIEAIKEQQTQIEALQEALGNA